MNTISNEPMIDAKDLANFVLDVADESNIAVTNLALQKLMFFCHGSLLVHFDQRLVRNKFEAWRFGPVIPAVYDVFSAFKREAITSRAVHFDKLERRFYVEPFVPDLQLKAFLTTVIRKYGDLDPIALFKLSHAHDGPWHRAKEAYSERANFGQTIDNALIKESFYAVSIS